MAAELLSCWCPPLNPALPGCGGCAQAIGSDELCPLGGWEALLGMPARSSAGAPDEAKEEDGTLLPQALEKPQLQEIW